MTAASSGRRWVRRVAWLVPVGRGPGMWAFVLNRVTGISLVLYLYLHLAVLGLLAAGPGSWDAFIAIARSPLVLALDVLLIAAVLVHGLNGIRLTLLGRGLLVGAQRQLLLVAAIGAVAGIVAATLKLFEVL